MRERGRLTGERTFPSPPRCGDGIFNAAQGGEHCTEREPAACIGFWYSKIAIVSGQCQRCCWHRTTRARERPFLAGCPDVSFLLFVLTDQSVVLASTCENRRRSFVYLGATFETSKV